MLTQLQFAVMCSACALFSALSAILVIFVRSRERAAEFLEKERVHAKQLALLAEQRDGANNERRTLLERISELEKAAGDLHAEKESKQDDEKHHFAMLREAMDVNGFVASIVQEFDELLAQQRVHLTYEPCQGAPYIIADHYLVDRIAFHLLSNAIACTPRGGEVMLRTRHETGRLSISVRDGGSGKVPLELTRPAESTNRVLSLIKRLAEIHGGSVIIHSRSSGGMTVVVNINAPVTGAQAAMATNRGFGLSRLSNHFNDDAGNNAQKLLYECSNELANAQEELHWLAGELQLARGQASAGAEAKAHFLSNMSHEIRTPLNGLIVTSELLLNSGLTDSQTELVQICRESASALLDTVNDLLDFSRMEDQQMNLDLVEFDVLGLVEGAAHLLANQAQKKNISLMTFVSPDVPRRLYGDPSRLRQILINLIGNGIKFTEQGEVVCRVSVESMTPARATLRFVVADTGIGLPEGLAQALFEPFEQLEHGASRRYDGAGLGLSIAKRLIELMGGKIGVASTQGRGATFWFNLPFEYQQTEPLAHFSDSLKNMRVLVVDARRGSQSVTLDYARSWGLVCQAAEGGVAGLHMMRKAFEEKQPFDVVIVDFDVQDVHPFAIARFVRTSEFNQCRLVLLTSVNEEGRGARALKCGFHAYLEKPVRQSDLFDCLANLTLCAQVYQGPARHDQIAVGGHIRLTTEQMERARKAKEDGRKLILVVEDNIINQRVARFQLEEFGYHVDVVNNGSEALESLERLEYDIVLMDCAMPVMDGYEATRRIRKMDALSGRHTKIVALTAHSLPGDREKCLSCGMDDYLSKPVSASHLRQTLERWLKGNGSGSTQEAAAVKET